MSTPFEKLLEEVAWEAGDEPDKDCELPYATHTGVLRIGGIEMRVARLSDGRCVIEAEDFKKLLGDWFGGEE